MSLCASSPVTWFAASFPVCVGETMIDNSAQGNREQSWVSFSHWNKLPWKQYIRVLLWFCFLSFFLSSPPPPFWFWAGVGSGTHALVHVKEVLYYWLYPQPKEISAEALSQDSGVVHGLGQDGILDLQGHNSDTYHGIGVEQRFCLRSVCWLGSRVGVEPTPLSCIGVCVTGFLWMP